MLIKPEYKELQDKILQHLFDTAKTETFPNILALIKKPESEVKYHCETLVAKKLISQTSVGMRPVTTAYYITDVGRKHIMES